MIVSFYGSEKKSCPPGFSTPHDDIRSEHDSLSTLSHRTFVRILRSGFWGDESYSVHRSFFNDL